MCQYWFIHCNKCTTRMRDVIHRWNRGWRKAGVLGTLLVVLFFSKPTLFWKITQLIKKNSFMKQWGLVDGITQRSEKVVRMAQSHGMKSEMGLRFSYAGFLMRFSPSIVSTGWILISIQLCVCVCVCVRERERVGGIKQLHHWYSPFGTFRK